MPKEKIEEKEDKPKKAYSVTQDKLVEELIQNNITLQHKVADMIVEMKHLNKKVGDMVDLFKLAGEYIKKGRYEDPLLVKLDDLLEQNKNIAKGLLLLEKFVSEKQERTRLPSAFGKEM